MFSTQWRRGIETQRKKRRISLPQMRSGTGLDDFQYLLILDGLVCKHQTPQRTGNAFMQDRELPSDLAAIRERYSSIYAIISPPRCGSTAFSRVFWEHPELRYYCHEPFEVAYYDGAPLSAVVRKLEQPLHLDGVKLNAGSGGGEALLVKEMPYQVGRHFPLLSSLATGPLIFLIRDPRLSIASRMGKKQEVGDDPVFPLVESGWQLLASQIRYCRQRGIGHIVVDAKEFRNQPSEVFARVFGELGLDFQAGMLNWRSCAGVNLDNLQGRHRHLYERVLASTGIEAEKKSIPPLEWFPKTRGFRDHVAESLKIYRELRRQSLGSTALDEGA